MISKTECKHTTTTKKGKDIYSGAVYQMRQCKDCGYTFKAERIE